MYMYVEINADRHSDDQLKQVFGHPTCEVLTGLL